MSRTEFVYGNVERNGVRNRVHHLDAQTLLELLKNDCKQSYLALIISRGNVIIKIWQEKESTWRRLRILMNIMRMASLIFLSLPPDQESLFNHQKNENDLLKFVNQLYIKCDNELSSFHNQIGTYIVNQKLLYPSTPTRRILDIVPDIRIEWFYSFS